MPSGKITAAAIDKLPSGATLWDTEVRGLGVMKGPRDTVFVFKGRVHGRQILMRIGRHGRGDYGIDDARKVATGWRLMIRDGQDPRGERPEKAAPMTVSELCDAYMEAAPTLLLSKARRPKRESTIATDRSRIEAHIKPLLGSKTVESLTMGDIETFMQRVAAGATAKPRGAGRGQPARGGKGTAARTVGLLGAILTYAMKRGIREGNPVRGVIRFADRKRERRLATDEYRKLAEGIAKIETTSPIAAAAIRFLALTGWRRGEVTNLRWAELDTERRTAILAETKTGRSLRPIPHAALDILANLPRVHGCEWVFPAAHGAGPIRSLPKAFNRARDAVDLPADITPHVLRHSAASLASDLGLSEATIAAMIGHSHGTITSRYIHAADAVLLAAADKVAGAVLEAMGAKQEAAEVVQLRRRRKCAG